MRNVFLAGAGLAVVYLVVDRAIVLLNQPSDLAVAAGYVVLLMLVSALAGLASWLWRRI
jgi:hypothetical protein